MDFNNKYYLKKTASGIGFYMFIATAVLYISSYAMMIIGAFSGADVTSPTLDFIISAAGSIISFFIVGLIYCKAANTPIQTLLPVRKVQGSLLLKVVAIALAVSLLSNYITDALLNNLSLFGYENNISMEYATKTPLENVLYVISVAVMPALVEEFMFRGIILHRLRVFGDGFAILVSSILFGLIHANPVQIPFAFIVGLALAFVVVKTGSILPSVIVHFTVNCSSVLVTILEESLGTNALNTYYALFMLAVLVGAIVAAISLGNIKDFFKVDSKPEFPQKEAIKATFTSTGIIFSMIFVILETAFSIII